MSTFGLLNGSSSFFTASGGGLSCALFAIAVADRTIEAICAE
jgi:hypothetical protein